MNDQANIQSLDAETLSRVLSQSYGASVSVEQIESDIENGAPTNEDGTISLVVYASWLIQQRIKRGRD